MARPERFNWAASAPDTREQTSPWICHANHPVVIDTLVPSPSAALSAEPMP